MSSDPASSAASGPMTTAAPTVVLSGVVNGATGSASTTAGIKVEPGMSSAAATAESVTAAANQVLDRRRLQELVKEVDAHEQLDEDVEDLLLHVADDFIEQTVTQAAQLAKHRKAGAIEVKDVQLVLERNWNMWIPGFGGEELRAHKRPALTEAHKSRMALIRKALKKY